MRFSVRVRVARQRAQMTQQALADRLGVTRAAVANWEGIDRGLPATDRLLRLAIATGVSFEWLATGRGNPSLDGTEETSAADIEFVEDPLEMRILRAFRTVPNKDLLRVVEWIEERGGLRRPGR